MMLVVYRYDSIVLIIFLIIIFVVCLFVSFFFASRRRHTRSLCDWSSDMCSSDLKLHSIELQKSYYKQTIYMIMNCTRYVLDNLDRSEELV